MVATPLAILTDTTVDDLEGRYEFVDELGDGASSKVFLGSTAPHEVPEREVAIKVMDANALAADVELLATVQAEVAVLKRVGAHPHIVAFIETCRDPTSFTVVTEALTGGDLFQRLKEEGAPLTEAAALHIFTQCCLALEHLHRVGFAHRDVKAENIVCVDEEEQQETVKLIDFGSSAPIGRDHPGGLTGLHATAHYCAPEVIKSAGGVGSSLEATNEPYDERCDLWSLGVLLYFLLSRRLPFAVKKGAKAERAPSDGAEDEDGLLRRVAEGHFEFEPASAWSSVSDDAKALISSLMTVDVEQRLGWAGIRAHPWCASAIVEREALVDEWLEAKGLPKVRGVPPAPSSAPPSSSRGAATGGVAAPAMATGTSTSSSVVWDGTGGAIERRAHAAASASQRLQAILERKKRRQGAGCCSSGAADEREQVVV